MKKRKKYIDIVVGAVILCLMVLSGLGVKAAFAPRGLGHRGYHHGIHNKDVADFILWKMDRHAKDLNLNDSQMQEYEVLKGKIKASMAETMRERKEFRKMFHEEIRKTSPDLSNLTKLAKERLQKMHEIIEKNLDLFMDFYNRVLSDNQKAKVIEQIRSRVE